MKKERKKERERISEERNSTNPGERGKKKKLSPYSETLKTSINLSIVRCRNVAGKSLYMGDTYNYEFLRHITFRFVS